MSFANEVMKIADKQNHHPDMTVHYDNVKLSITDHEKGKITDKCHKFVNEVDKIK
jgi:pterin-4a-carbinolamine dehydratase